MSEALKFKDLGNKAFQAGSFQEAIEYFTKAIEINPNDHVFYSNRSGAYASLQKYEEALTDAQTCVSIKPDWAKGYQRKGLAEFYLKKFEDAEASYNKGLEIDPNNALLKEGLNRVKEESKPSMGADFQQQMFMKLLTNPKTAGYMKDPEFVKKLQMIQTNPQMMSMYLQDPQIQEAFQVMFGMDTSGNMQGGAGWEDISPNKDQKMEEEEEPKPAPKMEEKKPEPKPQTSEAEEEKLKGNQAYKAKDFPKALNHYNKAIELDSKEVLFYNNKAAVFIEMKDYVSAMKSVDEALRVYADLEKKDFLKVAKLYARKAAIFRHQGEFLKSIEFYEKSLLEDNQYKVKEELKAVQKLQKEKEAREYVNPELAEQHNDKARDLFKAGDFPNALKEYEEAIKRNPKEPKLYNNKATCLLKLMDFNNALKAAEKALEVDPTFVKAYAKKGNAHFGMREYHKAMEAFQKGITADPDNKEFQEGISKTQMKLYNSQSETKQEQEERARHAMADPEIQQILQDPQIMILLRNLQEKPNDKESLRALQDPAVSGKIQKLIQAGVIRTG